MKKLALLVILLVVEVASTQSQNMAVRSYTEFTHVSPKHGVLLTRENLEGFKYGIFYQREIDNSGVAREGLAKKIHEVSFSGAYIAFPFINKEKVSLDFEIRTGVKNGQYFSITPSLSGKYNLNKRMGVTAGIGTRNFNATMMAGLSINLSN